MTPYRFIGSVTRNRRGSALILVLIMTLSLAGLAISAIYLSSSAGLLSRYYDRERNYRYAAEAAIAIGKSRIQAGDTTLHLLDTGSQALLSAASLTDASGGAIPRVLVNLYGANTGDTVGIYGQFVTLLAQAYDSGGTRMVRRLDLTAESFSRFAMFTNTFASGLAYGPGEFIRGRAHSNQGWGSSGTPGPSYFDTVSAHTTFTTGGTFTYPPVPGAAVIPMPTIAKLAALTTYASNANLAFTPQTATSASNAKTQAGGGTTPTSLNLSGEMSAAVRPTRGTRVSFKPVDVDNNGVYDQSDGMMMIFDAADGIDTSSLRVDLPRTPGGTAWTAASIATSGIVILNQCGLLMHYASGQIPTGTGPTFASAHNEFFPIARLHEAWVRRRLMLGTLVTGGSLVAADTTAMDSLSTVDSLPTKAVIDNAMSHGVGNSRCFPIGSPLLMLTERHTNNACAIDSTSTGGATLWGWGAPGGNCGVTKQYGGMDTTFTANVTRCAFFGGGWRAASPHHAGDDSISTAGKCPTTSPSQVKLGSWRLWGGAALPTIATSVIQPVEAPFLWPLFLPYNMNSKGVVNATTGPVYVSDTLRGFITFYESNAAKDVVIIDDLVYDQDPTQATALCRNFLGIIAGQNVLAADNGLNRPRGDYAGTVRWYGFPNFTLHAVTMALNGTVGVEDWSALNSSSLNTSNAPITSPATQCGTGNSVSGGCINQTGGVIEQTITATYDNSNIGMRENRTVDPCQKTNQRPPFFPATGRYLDNKYYEIDPTLVATAAQVRTFYQTLRGHVVP